jgi:hypothetical protein
VFIGYGDDDLLTHHAVLALDHLVRKAPRALVTDQGGAVCVGSLLGPRQQRRGGNPGVHAEGLRHYKLSSCRWERSNDKSLRAFWRLYVLATVNLRVVPALPGQNLANLGRRGVLEGCRYDLAGH